MTKLAPTHHARHDGDDSPWISYRASLASAACRDQPAVCPGCGCETDVRPNAHSPRCRSVA